MSDQIKNFMIGLFVLAATCVVIFILMFIHPHVGDKGKLLKVRFTNIDKVSIGTRVTYAGKPVGEIVGIHEVEFGREGKKDSSGHIYLYELDLRVDSNVNVFNSDEVSLRTSGLLGEKNVEISPLAPRPGLILKQIDDKTLYALETGSVEDTFKDIKEVSLKVEKTLDAISESFLKIQDEKLVENVNVMVKNAIAISEAINPEIIRDVMTNIDVFTRRVNKSWDVVENALSNIDSAALTARELMVDGQAFIKKIANSEGSINRLFFKDDLYLRTNSILSKAETILDDINHYGLLFSSDKGWQRLRARRLNLLQKLSTPQEFRNYFNDEIDQISTSISRVSMVLDKATNDPYCNDRMQDREFTKVFSELMRRVTMLEEEIRLYNTQAVESITRNTELVSPSQGGCLPNFCECEEYQ